MIRIILFLFFLFPIISLGQEPYYQKIGSANGLASNNIYYSFQDRDGFMWFGTDLGASRFDGYNFENFNHSDGLLGNEIFTIFQDPQGRIWFLSLNGELCYFKDEKFYNSENTGWMGEFKANSILSSYCFNKKGEMYVSTRGGGVYKLDLKNKFTQITKTNGHYALWYTTNDELFSLSAFGIENLTDDSSDSVIAMDLHEQFARTHYFRNELFVGFTNKLYIYTDHLMELVKLKESTVITWVQHLDNSNILIGTRDGMYFYDRIKDKLSIESTMTGSLITSSFQDREGNLWVTSLGNGIFFSSQPEIRVYDNQSYFPTQQITCLKRQDSTLWVGGRGGYYGKLNSSSLVHYKTETDITQPVTQILTIADDSTIITTKTSIIFRDRKNVSHINLLANDILFTPKHVYIASGGLVKITTKEFDEIRHNGYVSSRNLSLRLRDNVILEANSTGLAINSKEIVFIATQRGLYQEIGDKPPTHMGNVDRRFHSPINDLIFDTLNNCLYIATTNYGLIVLKNGKVIYSRDSKEGLSSNNVQSLYRDDHRNLWIGTANNIDLLRIDNSNHPVIKFGASIGLKSMRVSAIERIKNTLYIASEDGLITYQLNKSHRSEVPIILIYQDVLVNSIKKSFSSKMELEHFENSITIRFLGLSYKDMGNLTYAYKLQGFQNTWNFTKNRSITFEALEAGEYSLQLKAISASGNESHIIILPFIIHQPIWKTTWFIVLTLGLLTLGIVISWLLRIRHVKNKFTLQSQVILAEKENLELEKAYLLAEQKAGILQINPHFLFNSLNTIKGFYAREKFNEGSRFISKFSKLLRSILEINTQFISLEREINLLDLYIALMQKRYEDVFEYEITSTFSNPKQILIPPMILQPLVENAVIHGIAPLDKGKLIVSFTQEEDELVCKVIDNGVGYKQESTSKHKSIGISNIHDRLNLLTQQFGADYSLTIKSPLDERTFGTEICLRTPIKEEKNESNNN